MADEISKLAADSREAANNIQQINGIVTEAVHNLSESANGLVEYIQESILPDFADFVSTGEVYRDKAGYIENIMKDFAQKTDHLKMLWMKSPIPSRSLQRRLMKVSKACPVWQTARRI